MVLNDSLANALSLIGNCEKIAKKDCKIHPISSVIKRVFEILQDHEYIGSFEEIEDQKGNSLTLNLLGKINKCGVIKPRFSVKENGFEKYEKRFLPAKTIGIIIVSTSQGIMTHQEAKNKKMGGKLLAYCY